MFRIVVIIVSVFILTACNGQGDLYGEENFTIINGVANGDNFLLQGYAGFNEQGSQAMSPGSAMVVGVSEVTIENQVFKWGNVLVFDEANKPRLASGDTRIKLKEAVTVLGRPFEAGEYTVADLTTFDSADGTSQSAQDGIKPNTVLSGHTAPVTGVDWSPDGTKLVSSAQDNTAIIWDAINYTQLHVLQGHSRPLEEVDWSPDGTMIATASLDQTVILWNAETGEQIRKLEGHAGYVNDVQWSYDGSRLATASADWSVLLWDVNSGAQLLWMKDNDTLTSISWSPDNNRVAVALSNGNVSVWDTQSGQKAFSMPVGGDWTYQPVWSPDGSILAAGTSTGNVALLDGASGIPQTPLTHAAAVFAVTWSPDGQTLASGGMDNVINLWDSQNRQIRQRLTGHGGWVMDLAWSPDGSRLASAGRDNAVMIWQPG